MVVVVVVVVVGWRGGDFAAGCIEPQQEPPGRYDGDRRLNRGISHRV